MASVVSGGAPGPGALDLTEDGGWWAWFAAEVTSAADLTVDREYAQAQEVDRLEKALVAQQSWLSSFRVDPGGAVVELRYLWQPGEALRIFVHGRVRAPPRMRPRAGVWPGATA